MRKIQAKTKTKTKQKAKSKKQKAKSKKQKAKSKSKKHPLAMDEKLARGCFLAWIADEGGTMLKKSSCMTLFILLL
ncbi:hypothetical protein [Paenibacillus phytohabitans]|uniref:hypothetical protein n=1 Tax=Paenibacillus phytohabitans TaxID=2654978 RepID=UPI0014914A44|nr:hypothetical protein [Paenibacillus phytohabitans]